MTVTSRQQAFEIVRGVLAKMIKDEYLPGRAAAVVDSLGEATTPSDLGMDSLARFAMLGELNRALGRKVDPRAVSAAINLGDLLDAIGFKES